MCSTFNAKFTLSQFTLVSVTGQEMSVFILGLLAFWLNMELNGTSASQVWNVSGTNLSYILESFRLLERKDLIRILDLSDNQVQSLNPLVQHLRQFPRIEILNLSNNPLETLSKYFLSGTKLEEIYLRHNLLFKIPNLICVCLTLKLLDLHGNKIAYISNNLMDNCSVLETLDLSNNLIRLYWPKWISIKSLRFLNMSNNAMQTRFDLASGHAFLPLIIFLVQIDISGNAFHSVPNITSSAKSLEYLMINNNQLILRQAPTDINLLSLPKLKHLELSGNNLTYWPNITGNQLEYLFLDNNALSVPPHPDILHSLCELKVLILHNNKFLTLPDLPAIFPNLKSLSLHNNPSKCGCQELWIYMLNEFDNPAHILTHKVRYECQFDKNVFVACEFLMKRHRNMLDRCQHDSG